MEKQVDIAVVGCGPAGLSAAVNIRVRNRSLLLIGPKLCSSSLHKAHKITNYLGIPGVAGEELRQKFLAHIRELGIFVTQANVSGLYRVGDCFQLQVKKDFIEATAVILTTGVFASSHFPGEEDLVGKGVSYCATCDAMFYRDKVLAVVSEGRQFEEEVSFLAEIADKVYYFPQYMNLGNLPGNVEILHDRVRSLIGKDRLEAIVAEKNGNIRVDGVFLLKEQLSMSQLVAGLELTDGHVRVDQNMATGIPGLFAAGDVTGRPYQIAKAVGQGQQAALSAVSYLEQSGVFSQEKLVKV